MKDDVVLTKEGLSQLENELEKRKDKTRSEIAEALKLASEQGDLSENAAYKTAMEQKEFNENRISILEEKVSKAVVVKANLADKHAGLGETVMVERKSDGEKREYYLVGESEADPSNYKISMESPIGKALLGKKIGAAVKVAMPNGEEEFTILQIK